MAWWESMGLTFLYTTLFFFLIIIIIIIIFFFFFSYYLMNSNKGSLSCRWHSRLHKNNDEGRGVRRFVALSVLTCPIFWWNIFVLISCSDGEGDVCDPSLKVTQQ